uniref:SHSP domain-containing protein n=1 Tax=Physcomitrium patens TaxID=3218 RepID=A9RFZ7_PHYPA|nr:hypothetical protein PHYPA_002178 [Physcomitrium patens]
MALVLSPWFGIGCTRRSNSRSNCPTLFTDLVVVEVPLQKQAWAPVISPSPHNTSAMRWDDTAEAHIFKFACKNSEPEMGSKEGEASSDSQCKGKKQASRSFVRKFKWPENADMEQIKADVTNKTLIITMPKLTMKSPEVCKIDMRDGDVGV